MEKFLEKLKEYQILAGVLLICMVLMVATFQICAKLSKNIITVTGSYSQDVISDKGKFEFEIIAQNPSKQGAYKEINAKRPIIIKYLQENQVQKENIEIKAITSYPSYQTNSNGYSTNTITHYCANQNIIITLDDVEKIKKISTDITSLIDKGININTYEPQYFYSKLSDLKIEMLEKASKDAKQRANAMLKATGNRVGKIQSVKMGVFQITPADSNNVSDMGINDTTTIKKKITSVANVVFEVK